MRCKHGRAAARFLVATGLFFVSHARPVNAQSGAVDRPVHGEAEIAANDVYVRSGDSLNHYTIIKLNAGDRVSIVGERGDWYEILPPPGAYSLVSGDYVDTADGKSGVVNGSNVRVRAGSTLNDNKYTVQTLLNKGDSVEILGRNPDGFLRIKPPSGATLWISKQFVRFSGSIPPTSPGVVAVEPARSELAAPADSKLVEPGSEAATVTVEPVRGSVPVSAASPPTSARLEAQKKKLTELDSALYREFAKPIAQRDFAPLLAQYQAIAAEAEQGFIQQYAQRRVEEVQMSQEAANSINHWRKIDEIAETKRREFRTARATIPSVDPPPPSIEAKGELRISALFPPGGSPERYRLIDPASSGQRTIAYVEIPPESKIQVNEFLNKYVGVRALERRVQSGGVNPIPIYIADDLVLLEPPGGGLDAVTPTQVQAREALPRETPRESTPSNVKIIEVTD